jgi:transposase
MAKRKFNLTDTEVNELKGAYQSCRDGQTKIRYQAVRLYGTGHKVSDIEEISGCSRVSLMEWCRAYRQYGIAGLIDQRRGGNRAKLKGIELEQLQQQLEDYSPGQLLGAANCTGDGQFWTVPDLAKLVERAYQVKYQSDTSYRSLFKRCNFSCQRPGSQYWSRNELAVLEFEQQLEKKL